MEIREATTKEWKQVRDLYLALLKNDPEAFVDQYDEIAALSEERWIRGLENKDAKVFVAVENDKFIGMGRINFYKELPGIPVLHKLGVLSEYRGQGIARKLVKAREEWAKSMGAHKVRLGIIADRLKTIEFSKKNGYKIMETLRNRAQIKDGTWVDVVFMEKDLSAER
ncbi:MAG: GNAT family N-acetyltransferase [bacterium]|nr:GNAT family N-acetyltransferase [bacterium]